jgi:acyl-CoA thioesterase FadM
VTVIAPDVCRVDLNPRMEGANIRTWIGFKHLMYLAEDAVLAWFRRVEYGPSRLYHRCGAALGVASASVLLPNLVDVDDDLVAECRPGDGHEFAVKLRLARAPDRIVLSGKLAVRIVRDPAIDPVEPIPGVLDPFVGRDPAPDAAAADLASVQGRAFYWPWRARYFHCEYSHRLQHSAYIRALEEVVDRFLADRGLAIPRMLAERSLIPVVSRVRVTALADAFLDETIHTTFKVLEVLKEKAFDGQMDCYAERGDRLVHVATARILHGYAISAGDGAGQLAHLDAGLVSALGPTS